MRHGFMLWLPIITTFLVPWGTAEPPDTAPARGLLLVVNKMEHTLGIVDPEAGRQLAAVPTGVNGHEVITRDGRRAYVSNIVAGTVTALDLATRKPVAVIPISKKAQRISISVDDRLVFTADQTSPQLAVIDTATNRLKTWVPLPAKAFGTRPTLDGRSLLVTLPDASKVAVVDLASMEVARTIDVPSAPQEILVSPDNRVAFVSCDVSRKIAVVNLASWKVEKLIDVGKGADGLAWASLN